MKRRPDVIGPAQQRGAATLVVSLVTLVLVTLVTLYGSRTVLLEQRIMNNEARSRQAFEAAEAGLAAAMAYMRNNADRNGDGVLDPVFDTNNDGIGDVGTTGLGNGARVLVITDDLSGDMMTVRIRSQGFADDSSAQRTVTRVVTSLDPIPNMPDNPLTARGTVVISGSATIVNQEGHSTVWSGSDVDLGSNNATHTEVADVADPDYPSCMDTPRTCSSVESSNKVTEGLDVVEYDESLRNLTVDELFENFFGLTRELFRETMVTLDAAPGAADALVQLAANQVIWIEGDAEFSNNTTIGCTVAVVGGNVCPNANLAPSITIINGDATFNGTPHLYGLVFVTGQIDLTGNTTVYGAMVAAGDLTHAAGGSLDIIYDSEILNGARRTGPMASAAGSWRDF